MYEIITLQDSVRVPPKFLQQNTKESIMKALQEGVEGALDKDLGIVLCITEIKEIGEGRIIPGDGAVYYDTTFDVLIYRPELHEVTEGEVIEIVEFGAFIRLGPIDGLVHVSQLADDYMSYSKEGVLTSKDAGRSIKLGDQVRARIVTISLKQAKGSKIGLTMRQPGLGKIEWLEEEAKKAATKTTTITKGAKA